MGFLNVLHTIIEKCVYKFIHLKSSCSCACADPTEQTGCSLVLLAEEAEGNAVLDMLCLNITLGFPPRSRQFGYVTSQQLRAAVGGKTVLRGLCCV